MLHDGFQLADSEAIAEYLNEAFVDVPMLPVNLQLRAMAVTPQKVTFRRECIVRRIDAGETSCPVTGQSLFKS